MFSPVNRHFLTRRKFPTMKLTLYTKPLILCNFCLRIERDRRKCSVLAESALDFPLLSWRTSTLLDVSVAES
jgi:hypothetical protein